MKNLSKLILISPFIIGCSHARHLPTEKEIIRDTVYVYRENVSRNPLDTLFGNSAYEKAKEFQELALNDYYSGNFDSAKDLFQKSVKLLSQSDMSAEEWELMNLKEGMDRFDYLSKIRNDKLNGVEVTQEDIVDAMKSNFKMSEEFARRVAYHKKKFKTVNKKWFEETLARGELYFPYIDSLIKEKQISPFVKWMFPVESGMLVDAKSHVGAAGIAQFIPSTGKMYGLKVMGQWCDERYDPLKAIDASLNYIRDLELIFNDPFLSVAAYNAGENSIINKLNRMKVSSYDELLAKEVIPRETMEHIPKIYAYMELAEETNISDKKKNKNLEDLMRGNFDIVHVKKQIDFDIIAQELEISSRTLKDLNPAYRMALTPPEYMVNGEYDFEIRIPKGMSEEFYEKIPKLKKRVMGTKKYHIVKSGDSLWKIANSNGISINTLMRLNGLTKNSVIKPGQKLVIPNI